jgi:hypothetical protein
LALLAAAAFFAKNQTNPSVAHTLEVRARGTKSTASSGTRVDADAFVILEEIK